MADNFVNYEKLNTYNYKIKVDIIDGNNLIELENINILDLVVQKEFTINFFPILKIRFLFPLNLYYEIQQKRNTIKFKIRLEKYVIIDDNPDDQETESGNDIILDGIFQPITLSIDMPANMDLAKTQINNEKESSVSLEQATTENDLRKSMELYFFKLDHVNCNKKILNFIAEETEIKNVIAYIFNQVKIDKVIMDKPDNIEILNQVLIPPLNFKNTIELLSNSYGIFKDGFRQFLDFDNYYLLNNNLNQVPVSSIEFQNVYINVMKITNAGLLKFGSYTDYSNKCYVINTANNIAITSQGMISKEVTGNIIKVYDRSEIENAMEYNEKTKKFTFKKGYRQIEINNDGYNSDDKTVFVYNDNENDSAINELKSSAEYSNVEFTLTFSDIDVSILTMNKRYIFRFEDIDYSYLYNGVYILDRLIYQFDRAEDAIVCLCTFKKIT